MKRFTGVVLFLLLALVLVHIYTLYMLGNAQKRINLLEKSVESLHLKAAPPTPAQAPTVPSGR